MTLDMANVYTKTITLLISWVGCAVYALYIKDTTQHSASCNSSNNNDEHILILNNDTQLDFSVSSYNALNDALSRVRLI